jgi:hypothetical protein
VPIRNIVGVPAIAARWSQLKLSASPPGVTGQSAASLAASSMPIASVPAPP